MTTGTGIAVAATLACITILALKTPPPVAMLCAGILAMCWIIYWGSHS